MIRAFVDANLPIFLTRDWHPPNHISFKNRGGPWPPHCVQGTRGAEFHPGLEIPHSAGLVSKGDKPDVDSYSDFQGTGLEDRLKSLGVREVFVAGLATDYCVKETSIDALHCGFHVSVLIDCVKPIDVEEGDGNRALAGLRREGAALITSAKALQVLAGAQH